MLIVGLNADCVAVVGLSQSISMDHGPVVCCVCMYIACSFTHLPRHPSVSHILNYNSQKREMWKVSENVDTQPSDGCHSWWILHSTLIFELLSFYFHSRTREQV